jgi:hypothetical protein
MCYAAAAAAAAAAAVLARDLETVTFYDSKGEFAGVRRAGSGKPIEVRHWLLKSARAWVWGCYMAFGFCFLACAVVASLRRAGSGKPIEVRTVLLLMRRFLYDATL